jgi:ABC-type sugar transport system ATPase subunit
MACVTMRNLTKVFPGGTVAIDHVDLTVGDGEFVVLVGPSGCGKSTLLRMVAGLEDVTTGVVEIDGQVVNNLSPRERDIAMVFQNYALYPHYTVEENLGFSLRIRGLPRQQTREQVMKTARVLGLESFLAANRPRCPAGSASAWPWVVLWCANLRYCSWTNHCPTWTPSCGWPCAVS